MTRRSPPNAGGPRSERNLRVAGNVSHNRSDIGRASPRSHSSPSPATPTASAGPLVGTALPIVLIARGRGRFSVSFGDVQIAKASSQPICDAARVLHRNGYPDDCRLVARHEGADHHAISGPLGYWRKRRVREDRGLRYAAWEANLRRVGAKKGRRELRGIRPRAEKKSTSTKAPGAVKRHSPASGPSVEKPAIDPEEVPMPPPLACMHLARVQEVGARRCLVQPGLHACRLLRPRRSG